MDKRDRFELLSAYLDGEVTAAERRQVEEWLRSDATIKNLYARLLQLRQDMRSMPIQASQDSAEITVDRVLHSVNQRSIFVLAMGSATIVACLMSTVFGLLPKVESPTLQMARNAQVKSLPVAATQSTVAIPHLMVAINNPVIEIPKTSVANPQSSVVKSVRNQDQNQEIELN